MSHEKTIMILNEIDSDLVEECVAREYRGPSEGNHMKKNHSRRLAAIILAACLVFALGITAYATGAIQSLIGKFWSSFQYETPDDKLRQERPDYASWLDEQIEIRNMMLSVGEKAEQTRQDYPIPGTNGGGISLLEYYYDGEKIALACQFHRPETQVDFSFSAENYPNLPFQSVDADGYPSYLSLVKNPEELDKIQEKLQKDGSVSFLVSDCWLSDHVYANDADLGPCHGDPDENGIFTIDPIVMGMGEVVLPEDCQNREEITVTMTYRVAAYAFKLEGDAIQYTRIGLTDYPISFTIPNLNPASIPEKWSVDELGKLTAGENLYITQQIRGTTFTIQAPVPAVDAEVLGTMGTVSMQTDTAAFEKMGRELLLERFPQIAGDLESGKTDISLID